MTEFFLSGETSIAFERSGAGPVVIFLHGIGGNKSNWSVQLEDLSDAFLCVAWDARGYLDSKSVDQPFSIEASADDLCSLLDELNAPKAHIVGLSMGGYIALEFYNRHPDRVATLTLAGTGPGSVVLSREEVEEFLAIRLAPLDSGATMEDVATSVVAALAGKNTTKEMRAQLWRSTATVPVATYRRALIAVMDTDYLKVLPRIVVPTLIIVGTDDRVIGQAETDALLNGIKDSEVVLLSGAGHLCNIDSPSEFNSALRRFLMPYRHMQ